MSKSQVKWIILIILSQCYVVYCWRPCTSPKHTQWRWSHEPVRKYHSPQRNIPGFWPSWVLTALPLGADAGARWVPATSNQGRNIGVGEDWVTAALTLDTVAGTHQTPAAFTWETGTGTEEDWLTIVLTWGAGNDWTPAVPTWGTGTGAGRSCVRAAQGSGIQTDREQVQAGLQIKAKSLAKQFLDSQSIHSCLWLIWRDRESPWNTEALKTRNTGTAQRQKKTKNYNMSTNV